jgi:hypothetical protein
MTAVAGLRGTGDWGTDERPKNFRELILFRNPNGSAPLFALMARVASEGVDDPEFSWWDEPNDLVRVEFDATLAATATALTVDSADPSAAVPGIPYGNATHLKPGDLLMVEDASEAQVFTHEIMKVDSITSATAFVATRGVAGSSAVALADGDFALKIGSAYAEGTNSPDATSRNPIKYSNFCQIFKNAYELTGTIMETRARTGKALDNDKKRKTFDHSRDIELALMFGQKFETTGANGKPLRYMGGLREFIPTDTTTIFGASVTLTQYLAATTPLFDWDTPAGDERIAFCGNGYLNTLNLLAESSGQIRFGDVIESFGMKLREFILPQGRIYLRTHPLMNRHAQYKDSAFILDMSSLKWKPLRETKSMDNIQANDADTRKGQWLTEAGLRVDRGGLSCGYHGNFNSVA